MLSLFSNLYKFSLPGISRCRCRCGCGCRCWCWNTTCNLPNQVDQESQPWRGQRVVVVGVGVCVDVFVVVYDVASNFLQLIACNTNIHINNNHRHFLTVLTSLCTFRFLLSREFFMYSPLLSPWFSCCASFTSTSICLCCLRNQFVCLCAVWK